MSIAIASPQLFGFTMSSEDISVTVAGCEMPYSEILDDDSIVGRGVEAEQNPGCLGLIHPGRSESELNITWAFYEADGQQLETFGIRP